MHFALPPRKTSFPPPYARVSAKTSSDRRRRQIQLLSYVVLGALTVYLLFSFFASDGVPDPNDPIPKDSSVVIVTLMDEPSMSDEYIAIIKENRNDYARRHGELNLTLLNETLIPYRLQNFLYQYFDICPPYETLSSKLGGSPCIEACSHRVCRC